MLTFSKIPEPVQEFSFIVPLRSIVVLRITLKSNFVAPAIIQPKMDHWIKADGTIIPVSYQVMPLYIYLSPHALTSLTMSVHLPESLKTNDEIYSSVSFSRILNCSASLKLKVEDRSDTNNIFEQNISIEIPYSPKTPDPEGFENDGHNFIKSEQAAKILIGLAGLDMIPSKYLVAELILNLCDKGHQLADAPERQKFVNNLLRTKFFKNGVLLLAASHLINWVMVSLSISSGLQAVTGNKAKHQGMLQTWEDWLINLAGLDIEEPEHQSTNGIFNGEAGFESVISKLGVEPEKWFLYFVVGLMEVSPKLHSLLEQICANAPEIKKTGSKKKRVVKRILNEKGSLQR